MLLVFIWSPPPPCLAWAISRCAAAAHVVHCSLTPSSCLFRTSPIRFSRVSVSLAPGPISCWSPAGPVQPSPTWLQLCLAKGQLGMEPVCSHVLAPQPLQQAGGGINCPILPHHPLPHRCCWQAKGQFLLQCLCWQGGQSLCCMMW